MPEDPARGHHDTSLFEKLLAAVLGFAFLAVLAYAGLRERPITDPGQFLLLRVVASISAAACAAIIPGFLDVNFRNWVRAGGAIAVFVIVWFSNPPALVAPKVPDGGTQPFAIVVPDQKAAAMLTPGQETQFTYALDKSMDAPLPRSGIIIGAASIPAELVHEYDRIVTDGAPRAVPFSSLTANLLVKYNKQVHCNIDLKLTERRIWRVHLDPAQCD